MKPRFVAPLDPGFSPLVLARRKYQQEVEASGSVADCALVIERDGDLRSRFDFQVLKPDDQNIGNTYQYVERMLKFLLWSRGGWKVYFAGPAEIGRRITEDYCSEGCRAFDVELMSTAYRRPFEVDVVELAEVPDSSEAPLRIGGELDGCRIGIDLGASDYKISAVVNGEIAYSDEIPWDPKSQSDPQYHVDAIRNGIDICASKIECIDAIGVSSAGVYVDNEPRVASLFRSVCDDDFDRVIRPLFKTLAREYDVPLIAINDGEVSALAGGQYLGKTGVLGLAMGSSEAAGYLNTSGQLETWLNELAFCPVDLQQDGGEDEWSKDIGVGALYFSQQAVNRLALSAGMDLGSISALPERLVRVQELMKSGDETARRIYETIGVYLGYTMAAYREFYDYGELLLLGRVSSGDGGDIIVDRARAVLAAEFPELGLNIHLPDEKFRRVGQSVAAASLPPVTLRARCRIDPIGPTESEELK
jgi:predicted NBD/HSP70 family sugar kinase